jgi:predicted kinase
MKKLVIFRGPSGSGKTTAAKAFLHANAGFRSDSHQRHFEADAFFVDKNGQYKFDASKLGIAHGDCQRRVRQAMENGTYPLVLSNTSMTRWELNPYLAMAKEFGYEVVVYRIKGPWDPKLFASRNAHGVSIEIVQKQINKYQPLESEEEYVGE